MWKETRVVDERVKFIEGVQRGEASMTELCARFGVSRKTGYKWLERAEAGEGLSDRSRRPHASPTQLDEKTVELALALRREHPTWGPRKLVARFSVLHPRRALSSASAVGDLLKRYGLVRKRTPRPQLSPYTSPLSPMNEPNAVWCADFKGDFRTGDRTRVLPLTMTDGASRYLLRCSALRRIDIGSVKPVFESAFREFGMPWVVRTDNGTPFVTTGPAGLSKFSIWLLKLGIRAERTQPGRPTQNARHERMHRTLGEDAMTPPSKTLAQQQRRFDVFRRVYNEERPHEAHGMRTPASVYVDSARRFTGQLVEPTYPEHFVVRRVRENGVIKLHGRLVFVSELLTSESIGLEERDDDSFAVHFGSLRLGAIDADTMKFDKNWLDDDVA
jgi:transposase InsO family protein